MTTRRARITKDLARTIATATNFRQGVTWEGVRDHVDLYTGGDLDSFQLAMLTDWVWAQRREGEPE